MRDFQRGGDWHSTFWHDFVRRCGGNTFDPDRCQEVAHAFVSQIDAYSAVANQLDTEQWGTELHGRVREHLRNWAPDARSRQYLYGQPAEVARMVLVHWNPSDPAMTRHDNFAAYYTGMINRMRGEVVEGIHQAAHEVFRGRAYPPGGT